MLVFDYRLIVLFICLFYCLFFFLKMTKIKAIKEKTQNNTEVWTNPL